MSILFKNQLQIECGEAYTVDSFEPATSFYRRNPPKEKEAQQMQRNQLPLRVNNPRCGEG